MAERKKVLVVEDEADIRTFIVATLSDMDLDIREAKDGEEGMREATAMEPDLVILDIQLPKVNGFTVFRHIKANRTLRWTRVLVLTSLNARLDYEISKSDFRDITGNEPDAYLEKPFDVDKLKATVTKLLHE